MTQKTKQRILFNRMRRKFQLKAKMRIPLYRPEHHARLLIGLSIFAAQLMSAETARRIKEQQ